MYIQTEKTIAIAHLVQTADKVSPCRHLHGHNLRVVVSIDGDVKDDGMVVDFRYVKEIINHYDHRTLIPCHLIQDVNADRETTVYIDTGYSRIVLPADDVVPMCIPVVTSELLAMQILEEIEDILNAEDYVTVTIYESEKSFVEVSSDE